MVSTLDGRAIAFGGFAGFVVAFPGLVLGGLTDIVAFAVLVFAGMIFAGFVAGSKRPDAPLTHGIFAALATYAVSAIIAMMLLLAKGEDINPAAYIVNSGVAAGMGLFGGFVAEKRSSS